MLNRDELQRLAQALAVSETDGTNPQAVSIIRLLMLTGFRKSEIVTLMWKYVDFERKLLFLPDSKTGAMVVPLSDAAIAILEKVPRFEDRPEVFPAESQTGFVRGLQKMWERIRAKADLNDLRLHDLRHHFISVGASSAKAFTSSEYSQVIAAQKRPNAMPTWQKTPSATARTGLRRHLS